MRSASSPRRVLVSHAAPHAFAPMTRSILARLGYAILEAEEFARELEADEYARPDLRIVDERQLAEVGHEDPVVPIVVLSGRLGVTGADPRIVAALRRPAGVHDLYRIVQQVLEDTPRSSPRVPTHLRALCEKRGREWAATVLSLSENGCLMRSPEPLRLGARIRVRVELPQRGPLALEGEVSYQLPPDVGVVFDALPRSVRETLAEFVRDSLAAAWPRSDAGTPGQGLG
jgi:hypothetical protein